MPTATPLIPSEATNGFERPFTRPATSLERSTIKSEPLDTSLLRLGTNHYEHEIIDHHSPTMTHSHRDSSDGSDRQTSPSHHQGNRMSVSTLCSPHSSLPPHIALASGRGYTTAHPTDARLTHSPSSATSGLSPPSYGSSLPPPSPSIAVLDHIPQPYTHHSHRSISPAAMTPAQQQASTSSAAFNFRADSSAPSMSSPTTSDPSRKRKHTEGGPSPSSPMGDEVDERTKTWKHATGFRRDLTAARLTQPDAPTRKKRQATVLPTTPTLRAATMTPASGAGPSTSATGKTIARPSPSASPHSGSGDSIDQDEEYSGNYRPQHDEDDELLEAAGAGELGVTLGSARSAGAGASTSTGGNRKGGQANKKRKVDSTSPAPESPATGADVDGDELARLEKKRRQNTQAARRSRIRKAEEVQRLQTSLDTAELTIKELTAEMERMRKERDEARRELRQEVELVGSLKRGIIEFAGGERGNEVIDRADTGRSTTTAFKLEKVTAKADDGADYQERMVIDRSGSGS